MIHHTAAAWTGRMKVNGTGGYAGATPYPRLAPDIGDGFVTAGSNMGHDGGESASWTLSGDRLGLSKESSTGAVRDPSSTSWKFCSVIRTA